MAAPVNQVNIADNIPKYLQSELKFLTTQCAIIETESFGPKLHGALKILKQYPLHKCGHDAIPLSGTGCFLSMIGKSNNSHYFIATQDRDLQNKLQTIPGAPVLYLHSRAPVLAPPGEISLQRSRESIHSLVDVRHSEKYIIYRLRGENEHQHNENKPIRKRKGPKQPNSLSCKKKKIQQHQILNTLTTEVSGHKDKQKRKKKIVKTY